MLTLKCSDAGFDCEHVIHGESEKEIMESVADHASKVHGISANNMVSELTQKIKSLIKSS